MKNLTNQLMLGVLLTGVSLSSLTLQASAPAATLDWRFNNSSNPATPESGGTAQAAVTTGLFASGWFDQLLGLSGAQGAWDLGNKGKITLSNPSGLGGDASQSRKITVKVVQYYDSSGFYDELAKVSVPGGTLTSTTETVVASGGNLGDWIEQATQWNVPAATEVNSIVVNGAVGDRKGSVVDRVVVQSQVIGSPILSIRNAGGNSVEISWSSEFAGMVLEATSDFSDPESWVAVTETPQLSGATLTVTVPAVNGAKFYRLKQP